MISLEQQIEAEKVVQAALAGRITRLETQAIAPQEQASTHRKFGKKTTQTEPGG